MWGFFFKSIEEDRSSLKLILSQSDTTAFYLKTNPDMTHDTGPEPLHWHHCFSFSLFVDTCQNGDDFSVPCARLCQQLQPHSPRRSQVRRKPQETRVKFCYCYCSSGLFWYSLVWQFELKHPNETLSFLFIYGFFLVDREQAPSSLSRCGHVLL